MQYFRVFCFLRIYLFFRFEIILKFSQIVIHCSSYSLRNLLVESVKQKVLTNMKNFQQL